MNVKAQTDKELADRIVAKGVGYHSIHGNWYGLIGSLSDMSAEEFVRDWRVAGAGIQKCQKIYIEYIGEPEQAVYARAENNRTWDWIHRESLPRAINEACVEALDG